MENNKKRNITKLKKFSLYTILEYIPKKFIITIQKIKSKRIFKNCIELRKISYLPDYLIAKFVKQPNYNVSHLIYSTCFSPLGTYFATGSRSNVATIYRADPLNETFEKQAFKFYCLSNEEYGKDFAEEYNKLINNQKK